MKVSDLVELSAYGKKRFANKYMLDRRGFTCRPGTIKWHSDKILASAVQ